MTSPAQSNLVIYNNLTSRKETFHPIDSKDVRMYVCGMTVYDYCHIGHARVLVVFDMVYRHLMKLYGTEHVTYVRNITDIDDKIIARANQNNETYEVLAQRYIEAMDKDSDALGVIRPSQEPKATEHMDDIISMIQTLVDNEAAYVGTNNDVYYAVAKFDQYGKLSGKKLADLRVGERVALDKNKRDPLDFVLWKSAKPGEPSWPSPWGNGRPGWHIECSAMSTKCLGNHFDIHGGGMDLQFPHHENEIAQSEAATKEKFVNVWMHNAFVRVDDEKMSKSLDNFFTIREVLKKYDPEVVRFFILSSHYRSPLNYSDVHLDNAKAALSTLYNALRGVDLQTDIEINPEIQEAFDSAMNDDFNSPEAIAVLFEVAKNCNREKQSNSQDAQIKAATLKKLADTLGLLARDPDTFLQNCQQSESDDEIDADYIQTQINARLTARDNKEWAKSDQIRDDLLAKGVVLEDGANGTTWRRA